VGAHSHTPLELSDRELLQEARHGKAAAFEAVYRRHHRLVLAFLSRRVAEPELAADLMAETFAALLVIVRDQERELPDVPVAWLLGTARHLLLDSYRRGQIESRARMSLGMRPLYLDDADLRRVEEISAETDLLASLSASLTSEQLVAVQARVLDERDYPSIAAELRCSEAVVRKRVSRALHNLRLRLEGQQHA
jgi:RNA polymerase sigma-70 factor (ECF subfamily)